MKRTKREDGVPNIFNLDWRSRDLKPRRVGSGVVVVGTRLVRQSGLVGGHLLDRDSDHRWGLGQWTPTPSPPSSLEPYTVFVPTGSESGSHPVQKSLLRDFIQ